MSAIASIADTAPKRFQCRHIHADGRRCGSPALRNPDPDNPELCYYHHTSRRPAPSPAVSRRRQATFDLALPEDRAAIQVSIGEVLRRIACNQIDPRRAGLLLYGLQIASTNLPQTRRAPAPAEALDPVDEIVIDPAFGPLAPRSELGNTPADTRRQSLLELLLADIERGRATEENPIPPPLPEAHPDTIQNISASPATPAILPSLQAEEARSPSQPTTSPAQQTAPSLTLVLVLALARSLACHSGAKRRNLLLPLPLPLRLPALLLVIQERSGGTCCCLALALAVACSFACHSGAKRRDLLLPLPLIDFSPRSANNHPRKNTPNP